MKVGDLRSIKLSVKAQTLIEPQTEFSTVSPMFYITCVCPVMGHLYLIAIKDLLRGVSPLLRGRNVWKH